MIHRKMSYGGLKIEKIVKAREKSWQWLIFHRYACTQMREKLNAPYDNIRTR